jgi:hypothetical protein
MQAQRTPAKWMSSWNEVSGQKQLVPLLPLAGTRQPTPSLTTPRRTTNASAPINPAPLAPPPLSAKCETILNILPKLGKADRIEEVVWRQGRTGNSKVINWLREAIDRGEQVDWDLVNSDDMLGYLKLKLREFGPLIPSYWWPKFTLADGVDALRECMRTIPAENRLVIAQLLVHLRQLPLRCDTPEEQAALLAVRMLAPALTNDSCVTSAELLLKAKFLIENAKEIFETGGV